jgi:glutamate dehydrogenase
MPVETHWQSLARVAMRDDLTALARALSRSVLAEGQDSPAPAAERIAAWEAQREFALQRCRRVLDQVRATASVDMPMLSVVLRELRSLV